MPIDWGIVSSIGSILAGLAAATTAISAIKIRRSDLKAANDAEMRKARGQAETFHAIAVAEAEEAEAESVDILALCNSAFSMSGMIDSSHHEIYRQQIDELRTAATDTINNANSIIASLRHESDFLSLFDAKVKLEKATIRLQKINQRLTALRAVYEREIGFLRTGSNRAH